MDKILLAMQKGEGIKVTKGNTGAGTLKHRHKGVLAYHDPTTNHRNQEAKHPDYEFPKEAK